MEITAITLYLACPREVTQHLIKEYIEQNGLFSFVGTYPPDHPFQALRSANLLKVVMSQVTSAAKR